MASLALNRLLAIFACSILACAATGQSDDAGRPVDETVARVIRGDAPRPRLIVVISIDQFRADFLSRFSDLFLPAVNGSDRRAGGFRFLMSQGAYFVNARYEHFPLFTGPGHAAILTGAHPCKSGIVGNEWWDARNLRLVYCVEDSRYAVVGAGEGSSAKPMGPRNFKSSTVGDELKLATAGRGKVVSLAVKDRAAILMGGHAQDVSIWYDTAGGRWISSSAYCRDGKLPAWVASLNDEHIPDQALGTEWTPSLPPDVVASRSIPPTSLGTDIPPGFGQRFPHPIGKDKTAANYRAFILTPAANAFVFETANRAIRHEGRGQDDVPDILAMSFSTNDYVGHAFGPYSPETLEITVQTDRQLSAFINQLKNDVPGGLENVVIVLTSDHGVVPSPNDASSPPFNLNAIRFPSARVTDAIEQSLRWRFGEPPRSSWLSRNPDHPTSNGAFLDGFIWLNQNAVQRAIAAGHARSVGEIEQAACDAVSTAGIPGVYGCFGKTQIVEGRLADTDFNRHLARSIYPSISADLVVIPEQFCLADPDPEGHVTTHGTPYVYDAHVPVLMFGPKLIRPGVYTEPIAPTDIAPTLSLLLGVAFPSGCDGRPLSMLFQSSDGTESTR